MARMNVRFVAKLSRILMIAGAVSGFVVVDHNGHRGCDRRFGCR
jgi:hypothetical protein